jgi:aerobic carbon-monoxide dehydrogenase medium subunit
VKPAPFKYGSVDSVEGAVALLVEHGDEATVLAGGQSLIPMLNMRLARPDVLVDINPVAELDGIDANGELVIGAITRQHAVEHSAVVATRAPLLAKALRHVAHPAIRARGTLGGSAAHADPASEIPATLVALAADVVLRGATGERTLAAEDFFVSTFMTAREPDELLTHIRIPSSASSTRGAFLEVARRHGDYALVAVAADLAVDTDGTVKQGRIVLTNVADIPRRARSAEDFLVGRRIDDAEVRREAARLASEGLEPVSDVHASAQYRMELASTLTRRALEQISEGGE